MTIRFRIILGLLLLLAGVFFWVTNWLIDDLRPHYLKSMEESLVDQSAVLASVVSVAMDSSGVPANQLREAFRRVEELEFTARIYDFVKTHTNVRVYITDTTGLVIFDSDGARDEGKDYSQWNDVHLTLQGGYGARATRRVADDPTTTVLHVAAPLLVDGRIAGVLAVAKPVDSVNRFVEHAEQKIIAGTIGAAIIVFILGVLLSTWVTLPIRRLTAYARAVRDHRRVDLPRLGQGEMAVMGKALDEMRSALEGRQYVEQYVQTLTHEIKSPLSAIRGAAELLGEDMGPEERERFTANIREESNRIQGIVDRMLQLSSLESRRTLRDLEIVSLRELCEDIARSMEPQCAGGRVEMVVDGDDIAVQGERFLLRQAVTNLVQNAVDFSPEGGTVRVCFARNGNMAEVVVTDEGPGIPDYAADKVFDRFFSLPRPGSRRKSTGLGLSFVSQVAELHDGEAKLTTRPEGGTKAVLRIRAEQASG